MPPKYGKKRSRCGKDQHQRRERKFGNWLTLDDESCLCVAVIPSDGDAVGSVRRVLWDLPDQGLVDRVKLCEVCVVKVGFVDVEPQPSDVGGVVSHEDRDRNCDFFAWHEPAAIQRDSDGGACLR